MEYGSLSDFIKMDIGEGKEFWISGYANPNLNSSPSTNIKPTKVTMYKNKSTEPHKTGIYQWDKKFEYYVAKNDKGKIMPVNVSVEVYDTKEEATTGYNLAVNHIATVYQERIRKVINNLIE